MATGTEQRQLSQKEADIQMMLAAEVHLGTKNCDFQMERYVFKRRNDGMFSILQLLDLHICLTLPRPFEMLLGWASGLELLSANAHALLFLTCLCSMTLIFGYLFLRTRGIIISSIRIFIRDLFFFFSI